MKALFLFAVLLLVSVVEAAVYPTYSWRCNACILNTNTFCFDDYNCYGGSFTCNSPKTSQQQCLQKDQDITCPNYLATSQSLATVYNYNKTLGADFSCLFTFASDGSNIANVLLNLTAYTSNLGFRYYPTGSPAQSVLYSAGTWITIAKNQVASYTIFAYNQGTVTENFTVGFYSPPATFAFPRTLSAPLAFLSILVLGI